MLKRLELSDDDHRVIIQHCIDNGVEFLSTGFDEIDLEMLVNLGITQIKIPSGEMTNLPYLRAVASYQLPVLMSTGMATMEEVEASISALLDAGLQRNNLTILHCTSSYPAPDNELNLNAMIAMQRHFGLPVSYSDHSKGIEASVIAACLGAHGNRKTCYTGQGDYRALDHLASIEPKNLSELASIIRRKDIMMGSALKILQKVKSTSLRWQENQVAGQDIRNGDLLTKTILPERPGTGLSPMQWDKVIGTRAVRDFKKDETIILTF